MPFRQLALAAVLGQLDRRELLAEGWVEAAGGGRGELAGIADQDRLPPAIPVAVAISPAAGPLGAGPITGMSLLA